MILLQVGSVLAMATLLALWCGWGLARLTLPPLLQPWSGLLAPLMGYTLVVVGGYWGVHDFLGLPGVLLIILPLATLLNAVAWRRTGPPRLPRPLRDRILLAALLLATLVVGVAPILSYGYPAVIGKN